MAAQEAPQLHCKSRGMHPVSHTSLTDPHRPFRSIIPSSVDGQASGWACGQANGQRVGQWSGEYVGEWPGEWAGEQVGTWVGGRHLGGGTGR